MSTPRKPQDHQSKSDEVSSEFTYTAESGETITVPRMSHLKFGVARQLRKLDESEQMYALVEAVCDEETLAVVDDMESAEVARFFEAWGAASGVELGESPASSNS